MKAGTQTSEEGLRDEYAGPVLDEIREMAEKADPRARDAILSVGRRYHETSFRAPDVLDQVENCARTRAGELIQEATGKTSKELIDWTRCAVARNVVVFTALAVGRTCGLVGFENVDTFVRRFTHFYQASPDVYRGSPEALRVLSRSTEITAAQFDANLRRCSAGLEEDVASMASALADGVRIRTAVHQARRDFDAAAEGLADLRCCQKLSGNDTEGELEDAFRKRFCASCRPLLDGEEGRALRRCLRSALSLVPLDLELFQRCCDDCYRVVWTALEWARFAHRDDAFQVAWIVEHVDLKVHAGRGPLGRGHVALLLAESEKLAHRQPRRRLEYCQRAVHHAGEVGDDDVVDGARCYEGNALRALSLFSEAREVFGLVKARGLWVRAPYLRFLGTLECDAGEEGPAVGHLRESRRIYRQRDLHMAGLVGIKLSEALKWVGELTAALKAIKAAGEDIDLRRWPEGADFLRNNHAMCLILVNKLDRADEILKEDPANPALLPYFNGARGESALARGNIDQAIQLLEAAVECLLEAEKYDNAVGLTLELAEAYAQSGELDKALETALSALAYDVAVPRSKSALQGLRQLAHYTGSTEDLAKTLRKLARESGGNLPPLDVTD